MTFLLQTVWKRKPPDKPGVSWIELLVGFEILAGPLHGVFESVSTRLKFFRTTVSAIVSSSMADQDVAVFKQELRVA
eukprot:13115310-Alexandrium_andersonii.AAC.1